MQRRTAVGCLMSLAAAATLRGQEKVSQPIGCGQIGTAHSHAAGKMETLRRLSDTYRVVGIAEPNTARRERCQRQAEYQGLSWLDEADLLQRPEVQVVAIETSLDDAPRATLAALQAGKHVHLDKPGALRHDDFVRLRKAAQERELTLQMGYMLRYNPAFVLLFQAVREGWLGVITEIDAAMGKLASAGLRTELAKLPGGGMFELACHVIDAVVTLLGKPRSVTAFSTPTRAGEMQDNQLAVLTYETATATIRCNHADPFGAPHRYFRVVGTQGALAIQPLESGQCLLSLTQPHGEYAKGDHKLQLPMPKGRYDGEFLDLARVVRGEQKFAWSAEHDVAVHDTVLRAAGVVR